MRRRRTRAAPVVLGLCLALAAAGCGGLAVGSGVRVEGSLTAGDEDDSTDVRVQPPGPGPGASPAEVVSGFLNAQADDEDDYGIAREFLAPDASWSTGGAVTVYATVAVGAPVASGDTAVVRVSLARSATLGEDGAYTPRADTMAERIRLSRVGGEWRISSLPDGLQLTGGDLQRGYRPTPLWWFTPDGSLLVPELRWLPGATTGAQTRLVRTLLAGPSGVLAGAVRTAVPSGVSLDGSVSTSGQDIVVDLSPQAASLTGDQARRVLLQLARTLQRGPAGEAVRLQVDGQPLPSADAPVRLPLTAASAVDPDANPSQSPGLALVDGRLRALGAGGSSALPAPQVAAFAGRRLLAAVPAPAGGRIAALVAAAGGEQLLVVDPSGAVHPVGPVGTYAPPSWSLGGTLVAAGPSALLVSRPGAAPSLARYPAGLTGPVRGAVLARDGVRLLVVSGGDGAGTASLTTLRTTNAGTTLGPAALVSPGLGDVRDAAWSGASAVALLTDPRTGPPQLVQLAADGSQPTVVALPVAVGTADLTLSGSETGPVLLGGAGVVEMLASGGGWVSLGAGSAPAAPG